jgi:hypothetical protein
MENGSRGLEEEMSKWDITARMAMVSSGGRFST